MHNPHFSTLAPRSMNVFVCYQRLTAGIVIQPRQLLHMSQSWANMHTHTAVQPQGYKTSGGSVVRLSPRTVLEYSSTF